MAHKTCPNCGTSQPQDYVFCADCGTRLTEVVEESQPAIQLPDAKPAVEIAGGNPGFDPDEFRPPARAPEPAAPPAAPVAPAPAPVPRPVERPAYQAPQPPPVVRPRVEWTLVHLSRGGGQNEPFPVPDEGLEIGSLGCAVTFADDRTLSPRHAAVVPAADGLRVEDAGSVNGIFLKINGAHRLLDGDTFVCGDTVFRFSGDAANISQDDFRLFAAPDEICPRGTITKILAGGSDGQVYSVAGRPVVIGRESADVACPEDRYMSRVHAALEPENGSVLLRDKQSRNGTYVKTTGQFTARDGDVILVGRQLLRVEATVL